MSEPCYLPGTWFAVVSPQAAVLIDDSVSSSRLQAVWDTCNGNPSLDELIEVVTGGRFVGAPCFGIALADDTGLRVVVRAGVTAMVGESIGAARPVIGANANTWVEETLNEPQSIRLFRDDAQSPVLTLPVTGGIVFADEITWTPSAEVVAAAATAAGAMPAGNPPTGPAAPIQVAPSVPLAPVLRLAPAVPKSPTAPSPTAPPPVPTRARPATPLTPARPPTPVTRAEDSEWSVWALDEAGGLGSGADGVDDVVEPVEMPRRVTVDPGHDPLPLLPEAQPESPFEPPSPSVESAPLVESAQAGRLLGDAAVGYLHFSTGQMVPVDRRVIVGRAPSVDRVERADSARAVKIDNQDGDISRNHVEVRLEGGQVLVVDLGSSNGTVVTIPGRVPQQLAPQEPFLLVPGSVVALSDEVYFRYQVAE
jgi:hypothetical protein